MTVAIPYVAPRLANDPIRKRWGNLISEHNSDFNTVIESRSVDPEIVRKKVKYNQLLFICEAQGLQARYALEGSAQAMGLSHSQLQHALSLEAGTGVVADITSFVTQAIHMSLDVFPRLLANNLVSIQPLMQPSGYVFFMHHQDQTGRDLSDLALFNENYTQDPGEGVQIKRVKTVLSKALVEIEYRKLMWESSHEVMVALRSQYGLNLEALNDGVVAREMAWEVDRVVIDRLFEFAALDYYFDPSAGGAYNAMTEENKQAYDKNFLRKTMANCETDMQSDLFVKPNWGIAGTEVIKFLKRLRGYEAAKAGDKGDMTMSNGSVLYSGKIDDLSVWHDPQLDPCAMLVGHTNNMDPFYAGYIFSPFGMASILTAAWTDPDVLLTKKARALAFATKGIKSRQYARIHLRPCS